MGPRKVACDRCFEEVPIITMGILEGMTILVQGEEPRPARGCEQCDREWSLGLKRAAEAVAAQKSREGVRDDDV